MSTSGLIGRRWRAPTWQAEKTLDFNEGTKVFIVDNRLTPQKFCFVPCYIYRVQRISTGNIFCIWRRLDNSSNPIHGKEKGANERILNFG